MIKMNALLFLTLFLSTTFLWGSTGVELTTTLLDDPCRPLVVDLVPNSDGNEYIPSGDCTPFCSLDLRSSLILSQSGSCQVSFSEPFVIELKGPDENAQEWIRLLVFFNPANAAFSIHSFEGSDGDFDLSVALRPENTLNIFDDRLRVATITFDICSSSVLYTLQPGYLLTIMDYCPIPPPRDPYNPNNGLSAATSSLQAAQAPVESRNNAISPQRPSISAVDPISDFIRLQAAEAPALPISVEVLGADGRLWERAVWPEGAAQWELSAATLPPGLYLLRLYVGGEMKLLKVIKS
jgi:hypothetical protein